MAKYNNKRKSKSDDIAKIVASIPDKNTIDISEYEKYIK